MTGAGASPGIPPAVAPAGSSSGPVMVVGYGNSLRSDDGVGPAVAARLAEKADAIPPHCAVRVLLDGNPDATAWTTLFVSFVKSPPKTITAP